MKKIYFLLIALCFFNIVNAQIISFSDTNFKANLVGANYQTNNVAKNIFGVYMTIDTNNDGEIQVNEAAQVYELTFTPNNSNSFSSVVGINFFVNLKSLFITGKPLNSGVTISGLNNLQDLFLNQCNLSSINISNCNNLKNIHLQYNLFTNLDLGSVSSIEKVYCNNNTNLTSLNLSNLTNLTYLESNSCNINNLNISGCVNLSQIVFFNNKLISVVLNGLINLGQVDFSNNLLNTISLVGCTNIYRLDVSNNNLVFVDLNQCISMQLANFRDNPNLNSFFSKNGRSETINFNSQNLKYICCDLDEVQVFTNALYNMNSNLIVEINSYCSFVPGGGYFLIKGSSKLDTNLNGCDNNDIVFPAIKINIFDGINSSNLISNITSNYSIPVGTGVFILTPILENPAYFNVSPLNLNVSFPSTISPVIQNFCVTANGVHPDLEVTLLPINAARPGFDAKYKIIYKNKGNTTQSGTVNLVFNDAVLDLVSASPVATTQTLNNLSWAFTNLAPFETREINLTVNVNSPMETPAVNSGFILNYTATITSPAIDDLPNDNTFAYNQTVVNSYDPNDKTCLEGATITPTKVGDYVHYMIRFENNGTANAQNIVVKDMIDLAKFDINSIIPTKGSHSFVTNITSGNKVEFIFQNINLPFDNANNDGYVAFKIKTKSTLVLGNTFSNTASIYFDYNFPIVTNTASTTIAALSVQDFEFSNFFSVYPNPVENVLNVSNKEDIEITSITIYNTLGQLALVIPNAQNTKTIDVSSLTSSNYFIKINSNKGTSNTKFIKK